MAQTLPQPGTHYSPRKTMEGGGVITERQIPDTLSRALILLNCDVCVALLCCLENCLCFKGSELDNLLY